MKNLFYILMLSVFLVGTAFSKSLPTPPANCFSGKKFCSDWKVLKNEEGKRVIRVRIFADLPVNGHGTEDDLQDRYFDFGKWPAYADGSRNVTFRSSQMRINDQNEKRRHFANYTTKAPWPIRKMKVVDLVEYTEATATYSNSLKSYTFRQVPGFSDREGVKYNKGELHISPSPRGSVLRVSFVTDIVPSIDILPRTAAPYIQAPMVDILKGMFSL